MNTHLHISILGERSLNLRVEYHPNVLPRRVTHGIDTTVIDSDLIKETNDWHPLVDFVF